jgi:hypothetical protein
MQTTLYLLIAVAMFLLLFALVKARGQANLVVNGDMEIFSGTEVVGWSVHKPAGATAAIHSVETPVKSGRRSLVLKGQGPWMSAISSKAPVVEGTYRASAWVRTTKGHARIQINHWAGERWAGATDGTERHTINEWRLLSVETDMSRLAGVTQLSVGIVSDGREIEVYADEVVLFAVAR